MSIIPILKSSDEISTFIKNLERRAPSEDSSVVATVRNIIERVRTDGLRGVLELRQQFEGVASGEALTYSSSDFNETASRCPEALRQVIHSSIERVRAYHHIQADETRWMTQGSSRFASRIQPLSSVALYVPGGKAFYPSSVVMSAVPALVAGVKRIAVFTPARSVADPVFAATIQALGIHEVHAVGGAQAVAMAAFGVDGVERFDKIVGPGNIYVATAKQILAGRIGIDGFAGPSEILILSDGSSSPEWIALDLLAQAEHDEEASAVLVTTDESHAHRVAEELDRLCTVVCRDRSEIAETSLRNWGAICIVQDRREQVRIANSLNAEHLHIQTRCALSPDGEARWLEEIEGAGAIFMGQWSAESFGDYLAGPSHVLPTAGTARFASPLGVYDFIRRTSVIALSRDDSALLSPDTVSFAEAENLWAHAAAARVRGRANL
jgi:histidinol dehydrogenase